MKERSLPYLVLPTKWVLMSVGGDPKGNTKVLELVVENILSGEVLG